MNFSHRLTQMTIVTALILAWSPQYHAMIVGTTCLNRHINKANSHKLVLLYDQHALDSNDPINGGHVENMRTLVDVLKNKEKSVPFLVEISERQKNDVSQQKMPPSPSNLAIKLAFDNDMRYGNINFVSFDTRKHCDYWMRDMLCQRAQFSQAIAQNFSFPPHFYTVTAETFLNHLKSRHDSVIDSIKGLPVPPNIKEQDYTVSKKKYENCNTIINHLLKAYNINHKQHFFNLIAQLKHSEVENLLTTVLEEQSFFIGINLLDITLKFSQENPLCVVLAGVCHANTLEKRLLSQFQGFEKDYLSSMTLPDLKADDFSHIQLPKNVPDNFMNKKMRQCIGIDHEALEEIIEKNNDDEPRETSVIVRTGIAYKIVTKK